MIKWLNCYGKDGLVLHNIKTGENVKVFLDSKDMPKVKKYQWYPYWDKHSDSFRIRTNLKVKGKWIYTFIYKLILGVSAKTIVDHKDHNSLNNRRSNLRICTNQQNCFNQRVSKNNTSGFKGVHLEPNGRWRASIGINWKRKCLGFFDTAEEANEVYCKAAKELFGKFNSN